MIIEHVVPAAISTSSASASTDEVDATIHADPDSDITEILRYQKQEEAKYPEGFNLEEDDVSPEFANDPLFKLLKELNSSMGASGDAAGGSGMPMDFDPSKLFASMPGMSGLEGMNSAGAGSASQPVPAVGSSRTNKIVDLSWTLVHFLSNFLLAIYLGLHRGNNINFTAEDSVEASAEETSPARLLWYFATLELILQSSRFFLETRVPPAPSKIVSYASLLPQPFAGYIITGVRYLRIIQTIAKDFCLLLFIAGVASFLN